MATRMSRRRNGGESGRQSDWLDSVDDPLGTRLRRTLQVMNNPPAPEPPRPLIRVGDIVAVRQEEKRHPAESLQRARQLFGIQRRIDQPVALRMLIK